MQLASFKSSELPLAVVVAHTVWNETPRIRHHIVQQLMRWFNVLFIEFFPSIQTDGSFRTISDRLIRYSPQTKRLPSVRLYANDPFTHHLVNKGYNTLITRAAKRFPNTRRILINFAFDFPEIMKNHEFDSKIYICNDEFPRMQKGRRNENSLKRTIRTIIFQWYEDQVARKADRCLTPHYPLREKLKRVNAKVDMLFHAHNYDVRPVQKQKNEIIKVGYAGFLDWRLIVPWLLRVVSQKDMHLHLIGPVQGENMEKLCSHPEVRYVPPLSEQNLISQLRGMDVLVMPYDEKDPAVSILTTNSKTFQYIAACRPVVISNLTNYIKMPPGVIYKAETSEDFVAKIRIAYNEDCESYIERRAQIACGNTWNKRGDMLYSILGEEVGFAYE